MSLILFDSYFQVWRLFVDIYEGIKSGAERGRVKRERWETVWPTRQRPPSARGWLCDSGRERGVGGRRGGTAATRWVQSHAQSYSWVSSRRSRGSRAAGLPQVVFTRSEWMCVTGCRGMHRISTTHGAVDSEECASKVWSVFFTGAKGFCLYSLGQCRRRLSENNANQSRLPLPSLSSGWTTHSRVYPRQIASMQNPTLCVWVLHDLKSVAFLRGYLIEPGCFFCFFATTYEAVWAFIRRCCMLLRNHNEADLQADVELY